MVDSLLYAARQTLVAPSVVFAKIKEGQLKREVIIIFGVAMAITLAKALARLGTGHAQASNFFPNEILNELLSFLGNPLITWIYSYLVYFLFLWGVLAVCRYVFTSRVETRALFLGAMAISSFGVIAQIVTYVCSFFIPGNILGAAAYFSYAWAMLLTIKAVGVISDLPAGKASLAIMPPFLLLFMLGGMATPVPYLAWLIQPVR